MDVIPGVDQIQMVSGSDTCQDPDQIRSEVIRVATHGIYTRSLGEVAIASVQEVDSYMQSRTM